VILSQHRIIFLHVPKTGGSSIALALEALSDDRRITRVHHDGVNTFEIVGPVTPKKHATLADYESRLGAAIAGYRIAVGCREPFERMISWYFSPHRWVYQQPDGAWSRREPRWDRKLFLRWLPKFAPAVDFLKVHGTLRRPDWMIRYERLAEDFAAFAQNAGIDASSIPHVNKSGAAPEELLRARADDVARRSVEKRYAEDYELFGYSVRRHSRFIPRALISLRGRAGS
jgi:hypothetical protein